MQISNEMTIMEHEEYGPVNNLENLWEEVKGLDQGKHQPLISGILGSFVLIFSILIGTIANILAFKFFLPKSNIFFNAFKIVALSDLLICQLSTFYGISLVAGRAPLMFTNPIFCFGWSISWRILVRFSLHLVAIQSVLRTMKIWRPLQVLPKHILTVVLSFDFILTTGIFISDTTMFSHFFDKSYASCFARNSRQISNDSNRKVVISQLPIFIHFLAPYPVILTCCTLCSIKLLKKNRTVASRSQPMGRVNLISHSIISLLVFSLIGFLFNIASLGPMYVKASSSGWINVDQSKGIKIWFLLYGNVLFREVVITLNSILNPLIFLWRMAEFRKYLFSTILEPIHAMYVRHGRRVNLVQPSIELVNISPPQNNLQSNPGKHNLEDSSRSNLQNCALKYLQNSPSDNLQNKGKNDTQDSSQSQNENQQQNTAEDADIVATHEDNFSSNTSTLKHISDATAETFAPEDVKTSSIGNVIVHRNALKSSVHETCSCFKNRFQSECSSECGEQYDMCECCFLETNCVKSDSLPPTWGIGEGIIL